MKLMIEIYDRLAEAMVTGEADDPVEANEPRGTRITQSAAVRYGISVARSTGAYGSLRSIRARRRS